MPLGGDMKRILCAIAVAFGLASVAGAQDVRLVVSGGDRDITTRLERASALIALTDDENAHPQDYIAAARADYRNVLLGLYTLGHYGGSVSIQADGREVAQIPGFALPGTLRELVISVDPGPAFTFGRAEVAPLPQGATLPSGFATGEPALSRLVGQASEAGIDAWRALGHAKAARTGQEITAHHPDQRLDAVVRLSPGPRLRFGALSVTGNAAVRTDRIRAIAGLPEGAIYDPVALEAAADRLRRTGVFRSVSLIEAETYAPDLRLPIEAQIDERLPRRIGAGVEYSSSEGASASAYWIHRNLLGGAERLRLDAQISQIATPGTDYQLGARFERPATFGALNTFTAGTDVKWVRDPGYKLRSVDLGVGLARTISDDLTVSFGVGLTDARIEDALGLRYYRQLTLPLRATLDRRDDERDATRGYYIDLQAKPFVGLSGSSSGLRLYSDARAYRSFGDTRPVTLAGRLQLGSLIGPEPRNAPANDLFFSGGGGSVRGHDYQSLGIVAPGGSGQIGGRSFLGVSAEIRASIRENIGIVGFYDFGYISADPLPGQNGEFHHGAGLGLRYDTSLGPIRLDVALPVQDRLTWRDAHFYIGIGQSF